MKRESGVSGEHVVGRIEKVDEVGGTDVVSRIDKVEKYVEQIETKSRKWSKWKICGGQN